MTTSLMNFSVKSFGVSKERVIFLFTAFGTKYWWYYSLIKILTTAGYYVLVYDVNANFILTGTVAEWLHNVDSVIVDVKRKKERLEKYGAKRFFAFGVSMGTLLAMRIAIEIPEIKKVVVNLTYGSLADNIWSWKRLKTIRKRLEQSHIDKTQLNRLLEPIAPLAMAK